MNTEKMSGQAVAEIEATNDLGERFGRVDCPSRIQKEIDRSIMRGHRSGIIYSAGLRWTWQAVRESDVVLELERAGQVIERHAIPRKSWRAFEIAASQNGMTAQNYLLALLARGANAGESVNEMVYWLFR